MKCISHAPSVVRSLERAIVLCVVTCAYASAEDRAEARDPGVRAEVAGAVGPVSGVNADYFANLRAAFEEVYSVAGDIEAGVGLGPRFNGTSCAGCHAYPAAGGSSPPRNPQIAMAKAHSARNSIPEFLQPDGPIRAVRVKSKAGLIPEGEVAPLFTITGRSDARKCVYNQPDFSNPGNLSFRIPTAIFGAGLIENIPDAEILKNQALAKRELGISGRPNTSADGSVGRFGWKAQQYSLARFAGEAYDTEMGVLNSYSRQPREPLNEVCLSLYWDDDPTNYSGSYSGNFGEPVFLFTEYMRYLSSPKPVKSFPGVSAESIERGSRRFTEVGCAHCHTPALPTGNLSNLAALNNSVAHLYSDLLLHHTGSRLADGITQGVAGPDEFRTAPLWGLGQRVFFLHDGRTSDLLVAIKEHKSDGEGLTSEANTVIDRFDALSPTERQNILNFLRSL